VGVPDSGACRITAGLQLGAALRALSDASAGIHHAVKVYSIEPVSVTVRGGKVAGNVAWHR
jgi:hypothetical protein